MTQAGSTSVARRPLPERMTYEEFLRFPHENQHVEWVEGRVVPMAAVTDEHSDIVLFLSTLLRLYTEKRDLGVIRGDPFNMKIGPDLPGRQPDLLFLRKSNLARLHSSHLDGPADFVIEVMSPGSRRTDRVEKFQEYERGGVGEYLIIDAERRQIELYRLADGIYDEVLPDSARVLRSEVIDGFWLKTSWFTNRPLPTLASVLSDLGV